MQLMNSVADRKKSLQSRSFANKLGGGWERKCSERPSATTTTVIVIGLRLLLLAVVLMEAKALPPQTNIFIRQMTNKLYTSTSSVGAGRKYSQLCAV